MARHTTQEGQGTGMNLRSLDEFRPLLDLNQPNVICLPEEEFFGRLEELASTSIPTTLISHCLDQVSGFQHHDKIKLLNQLASNSGGEMVLPENINQLSQSILNDDRLKTVIYSRTSLRDLIHEKWLFFFLLLMLSLEWFMRKRNGIY